MPATCSVSNPADAIHKLLFSFAPDSHCSDNCLLLCGFLFLSSLDPSPSQFVEQAVTKMLFYVLYASESIADRVFRSLFRSVEYIV